MAKPKYQLITKLRPEHYQALKADIEKRGVLVPVEVDEDGAILDGHNRVEIAEKLGKPYKKIVRRFKTEEEKREHVYKLNLCRRHLEPHEWGIAFRRWAEERGARTGEGGDRKSPAMAAGDTISALAEEIGVPERTARSRMKAGEQYEALPAQERKAVDKGEKTINAARRDVENAKPKPVIVTPKHAYQCLVVDPPWPMQKIERELFPDQIELGYPQVPVDELLTFPDWKGAPKIAPKAHLFLWTTQKHLWHAHDMMEAWGFTYLVAMVWHKSGGFQPAGLPQYNCEFALLGRRGGLEFETTKAFPCCFNGKRREHSRKPDELYDIVRRVSPERRIDVFSREKRPGFDQWGPADETGKFSG